MKRRLLALCTTCLAAAPAYLARSAKAESAPAASPAAQASSDDGAEADSSDGAEAAEGQGETAGQTAAPNGDYGTFRNGVPKPPPDSVAMPVVNETHTVVKGDTLWDLSQHYLGNPWYWPKVWSYNPQIANPHWIYPGNEVKFSGQGGASADEEAPEEAQPVAEGDDDDMTADDDTSLVSTTHKIGYVAPRTSSFRQDGLVTDRELEESGQIVRSTAEKQMLDNMDNIYCRFKAVNEVKPGDRYFIFRTVREVNHPITGAHYGYITHVVGTARAKGVANGLASAVIDNTYDEIRRGDYLAPYSDKLTKQVPEKAATRQIAGYVLDSLADQPFLGEAMTVFIDKGKRDGIEEGNVVEVIRQADGLASADSKPGDSDYNDARLPAQVVGRLLVIDTKEGASTCLVLNSVREFVPGDRWITATGGSSVSLR